jgi:hypothetical protein
LGAAPWHLPLTLSPDHQLGAGHARGGVIWVTDEAMRLEERFSGEVALPDIAVALTRQSLRSGVGVRIGDAAAKPDAHDAAGRVAR